MKPRRRLGNRGEIDPIAWITGVTGFFITYAVWTFASPVVVELIRFGVGLGISEIAVEQLYFTETVYNWGLVINAGVWILYIILSSVLSEETDVVFR